MFVNLIADRYTAMEEKKVLRKEMTAFRAEMNVAEKEKYDSNICRRIEQLIAERQINVVHTYLPMGTEINITPLIQKMLDAGITVVTPKALKQRQMQNLVLHSLSELEAGIYGTQHPANSTEYTGDFDLFIIPGLAFDNNRYRLGYGSGYYDTFLHTQPNAYKLGICYPFQVIDKVPTEPHDIQLDALFY
jgi:5-formyltetrahydrofolate cyclo-ligase